MAKSKVRSRSPREVFLQRFLTDLKHDIEMFRASYVVYSIISKRINTSWNSTNLVLLYLALDSFSLHANKLRDFFADNGSHIYSPRCFVPKYKWRKKDRIKSKSIRKLEKTLKRCPSQSDRLQELKASYWKSAKIFREIDRQITVFEATLYPRCL